MVVWQIQAGKCGMTTLLSILLSLHEVVVLTGVCYAYLVLMTECQWLMLMLEFGPVW